MDSSPEIIRWQKGRVSRTKEHFELRYGSVADGGWSTWIPVALVGPPKAGVVNVQFLVKSSDPRNEEIASDVIQEIQFYLFDVGKPDPWSYAKYHTGTGANIYSIIHWSFCEPKKLSSKL